MSSAKVTPGRDTVQTLVIIFIIFGFVLIAVGAVGYVQCTDIVLEGPGAKDSQENDIRRNVFVFNSAMIGVGCMIVVTGLAMIGYIGMSQSDIDTLNNGAVRKAWEIDPVDTLVSRSLLEGTIESKTQEFVDVPLVSPLSAGAPTKESIQESIRNFEAAQKRKAPTPTSYVGALTARWMKQKKKTNPEPKPQPKPAEGPKVKRSLTFGSS